MATQSTIQLHDLHFEPLYSETMILDRVRFLGETLAERYAGKCPVFLVVLNGAFVFAADLLRAVTTDCEVQFVKLRSYSGTASTGHVQVDLAPAESLSGRHVVVVEDIVDSGETLFRFLPLVQAQNPASLAVCTLLSKPEAMVHALTLDYSGFEIPNDFVVGYGLDYNGLGRNLPGIWRLAATP